MNNDGWRLRLGSSADVVAEFSGECVCAAVVLRAAGAERSGLFVVLRLSSLSVGVFLSVSAGSQLGGGSEGLSSEGVAGPAEQRHALRSAHIFYTHRVTLTHTLTHTHSHTHTETHTHVCFCEMWGHPVGVMVFILFKLYVLMPYTNPTHKLSPHRKLWGEKNSLFMIEAF